MLHSTVGSMAMGRKLESQFSHITFIENDHEIISTVILPLPLIQEVQLPVTDETVSTSTG